MRPLDLESEVAELQRRLAEQAEELERLRGSSVGRPSRRALLTGGAAAAGGVLVHNAMAPTAAHATDGHDIVYPSSGETVHLFLKANGNDVRGESTQTSLGREGSIECFYFQQKTRTVRPKDGGPRLEYDDVVIRKRVDKASPLISRAHDLRERLTGTFKFFRPNPTGDGTTEQFFTIAFGAGRVEWQDIFLPDLAAGSGRQGFGGAPYEEIGLRLSRLSWTYTNGGITWEESR